MQHVLISHKSSGLAACPDFSRRSYEVLHFHAAWLTLIYIYNLVNWGPWGPNESPVRILFVKEIYVFPLNTFLLNAFPLSPSPVSLSPLTSPLLYFIALELLAGVVLKAMMTVVFPPSHISYFASLRLAAMSPLSSYSVIAFRGSLRDHWRTEDLAPLVSSVCFVGSTVCKGLHQIQKNLGIKASKSRQKVVTIH